MKKRLVFAKILQQQNVKKVSIIIGPRQVGKTTLLKQLQKSLGGLFFDVDIFSDYEQIATYERFLTTLKTNGFKEQQKEPFFVYVDEFQRYPELARMMKAVHDHHDNIKLFATGSASLEIKNAIQESLAGRKMITHVYPLNFAEFLHFKNRDDVLEKIRSLPMRKTDDYFASLAGARELLEEFLVYGGYPEVVLADGPNEKQDALRSIFDLYIKKDFAEYVKIEKLRNANQLMKVLAINHGQCANFAKYAGVSELSIITVKNYVSILNETFITTALNPYFTNKNKEISKMPRIYFIDNGVRNFFLGNFTGIDLRQDGGFLFEGFYISELIKEGIEPRELKYYRTKNGDEVDIVLEKNATLIPIEIKYKKTIKNSDIASLQRFLKNHKVPLGYVISAGEMNSGQQVEIIDCFRNIPLLIDENFERLAKKTHIA